MRTASGLMIAALLTTSMISGTFAKYTTADAAQDSARAAKWGVNLGISGSLYGDACIKLNLQVYRFISLQGQIIGKNSYNNICAIWYSIKHVHTFYNERI